MIILIMIMSCSNSIKALFVFRNREACDSPFDFQVNSTVEVQKSMKSIAREVHLPAVVQSEFYEATRILFVHKEKKITNNLFSTICLLSVSPRHRSAILNITHRTHAAYALLHPPRMQECVFYVYLHFDLNENSAFLPGKGTVTRLPVLSKIS